MSVFKFKPFNDVSPMGSMEKLVKTERSSCDDKANSMISELAAEDATLPSLDDADHDVEVMLASLGLQLIRRYIDQHHWTEESRRAHAADKIEPGLKLENVAAHSWHVADSVMLLAPAFPEIDDRRALELAVIHDKLELFTGDFDPVGPNGDGSEAHAFDHDAREAKTKIELAALEHYLAQLRTPIRDRQRELILESINSSSIESRFVKGVDKLQALIFVLAKKAGAMTDEHVAFSLRYSSKAVEFFPGLKIHYQVLVSRLLRLIADDRQIPVETLIASLPPRVRPIAVAAER